MKFGLSLLIAFLLLIECPAQEQFDRSAFDKVSDLLRSDKTEEAFLLLQEIRTQQWSQLDCEEQTLLYKLFGNYHYYLYEDNKALTYYKDSAYQKVKACNLDQIENDLLNNIGNIYKIDKHLLAHKYYSKLRSNYLSNEMAPSKKSVTHLLNLAKFYDDHYDLYNSFLCGWKAKEYGEILDYKLDAIYNILGIHFERINQNEEALHNFRKAIEVFKSDQQSIPVKYLYNQAVTYRYMERYEEALAILENLKHQEVSEAQKYDILNLEAVIYTQQSEYQKAEKLYAQLDKISATNGRLQYHKENHADLKLAKGDINGAIQFYQNRLNNLEEKWKHLTYIPQYSSDLIEQTDLLCLLSKAQYLNSKKGDTQARRKVFDNYDNVRNNVAKIVGSNWDAQSSSHLLDEVYEKLYYVIMAYADDFNETDDLDKANKAYEILSTFKNQILERDIQNRVRLEDNLEDTVLARYYDLKSDLNVIYEEEVSTDKSTSKLIQRFERYQVRIDSLLHQKNVQFSLNPKSYDEIQNDLNDNEGFLDLYYAKGKLISFWITKNEIKINSHDLSQQIIFNFLESIRTGKPISESSNQIIYDALFSQISLEGIEHMTVHADGLFHKLPIGSLKNPISGKYLIEDFSFRYLVSTDSIYTEQYNWSGDHCLGLASDYAFNPAKQLDSSIVQFSQLTGTIDELSILSKHYRTTSLINDEVSYDNVQDHIVKQNFNIVQISLHGLMDDRYPAMSGLIFENDEGVEMVDLNKMTGLNLKADLIIVNSCHSGDGKHITGEAISNLNTSLFIGGSKANMVNLWTSSDKASSQILKHFHNEIANGQPKSTALQLAKKQYLSSASPSFKHPKYWSSLVLFGNDSPCHSGTSSFPIYILLALLIGLISFFLIKRLK